MAVVTLLSDFVDGTCMALSEDTDAKDLNAYMTQSPGQLWAGVQQRRRARGLTRERRGPGTLYYATNDAAHARDGLPAERNGVKQERQCMEALWTAGVEWHSTWVKQLNKHRSRASTEISLGKRRPRLRLRAPCRIMDS